MSTFDVLLIVCFETNPGVSWYRVMTVKADSEKAAKSVALKQTRARWRRNGSRGFVTAVSAGKSGTYDQFVGKYVGQFIDDYKYVTGC